MANTLSQHDLTYLSTRRHTVEITPEKQLGNAAIYLQLTTRANSSKTNARLNLTTTRDQLKTADVPRQL